MSKTFSAKTCYHNLLEAPSGSCPPAEYMYLNDIGDFMV